MKALLKSSPIAIYPQGVMPSAGNEKLRPDLQAAQGVMWKTGQNIRFFDGKIQKAPGWVSAFASSGTSPIRGIGQLLNVSTGQQLFFGDKAHLWHWNAVNVTDVSKTGGYTGSDSQTVTHGATQWSMQPWGKWMAATNGVDPPQLYKDTTGTFADLTATFTTAEIFVRNGPYLLAFNTSHGPNWVEWCTADDIETWAPTPKNTAGNYVLRDIDSRVIAAVPIGDHIGIYSHDQMFVGSFIGAPYVFGFRRALDGIGAVSKQCVVPVGRFNFGVSSNGFWKTDGSSYQYIDDAVKSLFLDNVNQSNLTKIVGYHNEQLKQVIWFYPTTTGEPDTGLGYDYENDAWHIYSYGRSAAVQREVFQYPILGAINGSIYFGNFGVDADGQAITADVQSYPLPLGNEVAHKLIQRTYVGLQSGSVNLYIGAQERLTDAITWHGPYTIDTSMKPVYTRIAGRWISYKLQSTGVGDDWKASVLESYGNVSSDRP